MRILLVEDHLELSRWVGRALEKARYTVERSLNGADADARLATERYDLVILDLSLARLDGLEVLRRLRARGNRTPVLIVTARAEVSDRVRGLDLGADDYVLKPVDLHELAARLRALVRRAHGVAEQQLALDGVVLDAAKRLVTLDGEPVNLSAREFDVLHALMLADGRVLSREQLEQRIYGWGQEVESNAVEVHIHHLRRKLRPSLIQTVRGIGYAIARAPS